MIFLLLGVYLALAVVGYLACREGETIKKTSRRRRHDDIL